jgi:hypothetical protein
MPAQERRGLHEQESGPPTVREPGRQHHPPAIGVGELRTRDLTAKHEELPPEQGVLGHELDVRADQIAHDGDEPQEQVHQDGGQDADNSQRPANWGLDGAEGTEDWATPIHLFSLGASSTRP